MRHTAHIWHVMASGNQAIEHDKVKLERMRSFKRFMQMTYFVLKMANVAAKQLVCRYDHKSANVL